jgi:oligoendopeptidase F
MTQSLPKREEVEIQTTWGLESVFKTRTDFDTAFAKIEKASSKFKKYRGKITSSPAMLLSYINEIERWSPMLDTIVSYASMIGDQDSTNQANAMLMPRAMGLAAKFRAATAFAEPELLAKLSKAKLAAFIKREPRLKKYIQYFENLQRQQKHIRNAEVEQLLAQASDTISMPYLIYGTLTDAEMKFADAKNDDGKALVVEQGSLGELLHSEDRATRKTAWESYADGHLSMKNTITQVLTAKLKASAFNAQARHFKTTHEASLFGNNIPVKVYNNVIDACNRHLHIWHRYWEVRRRALKIDKLRSYDVFAPLCEPVRMTYREAVDAICEGMKPLGDEYVNTVRRGCLDERWVDVYPNVGKRSGAYSSGTYLTRPFILMSYSDAVGLSSMSTLAHEIGHSMHSYLSNKHQPYVYSNYSLFVAEVASNFNQAMVRTHLLNNQMSALNKKPDIATRNFQINVIEEAMRNFHRYLFIMPILSQFEQHVHGIVEKGGALSADEAGAHLAGLFKRGYGEAGEVDEARDGITWATFSHLYADFYVYQYASGIAAANALADTVSSDDTGRAAERYLKFLSTGSSVYPLQALKIAGIDMTQRDSMDRAFKVLDGFVSRLEMLVA